MRLSAGKQPAITKHPDGTASFCIRVCLPSGWTWEIVTEKPRSIAEIATSLEDYAGQIRSACLRDEAQDAATRTDCITEQTQRVQP